MDEHTGVVETKKDLSVSNKLIGSLPSGIRTDLMQLLQQDITSQ